MFRRKLVGLMAVMSLLAVGSGSAFADHHGGWHHHGGTPVGMYRGGTYRGGYVGGVRPLIVAPRPVIVAPRPVIAAPRQVIVAPRPMIAAPRQVLVPQAYPRYGTYGTTSTFSFSSPGFGLYLSR